MFFQEFHGNGIGSLTKLLRVNETGEKQSVNQKYVRVSYIRTRTIRAQGNLHI